MEENLTKNRTDEHFAIYHDLVINASLTEVFEAVTKPEHLVNWWPLKCTGTPEIGGTYNFYFGPEYDWYGQVKEYSPNRTFYIKMTRSDTDWDPTTLGFDMEEADGKVQLRFSHTDWPERNEHYRRSSFCWGMLLNGLKNYVEKDIVVPFEERE